MRWLIKHGYLKSERIKKALLKVRREEFIPYEIDPLTFSFAKKNLNNAGYNDVVLVRGDGGYGYSELFPYDRICITAASKKIPIPLIEQLKEGGKLIAPVIEKGIQYLVLLERGDKVINRQTICEVLYVSLRGRFGVKTNRSQQD